MILQVWHPFANLLPCIAFSNSRDLSLHYDSFVESLTVFRIRIRIHMFLGLPDPDPDALVRVMDPDQGPEPDPSIMQK
jgi:hypothetical protein